MWISCTGSCWLWLFCPTIPSTQCFISLISRLPPLPALSLSSWTFSHFLSLPRPVSISASLIMCPLIQFDTEGVQERKRELFSALKLLKKMWPSLGGSHAMKVHISDHWIGYIQLQGNLRVPQSLESIFLFLSSTCSALIEQINFRRYIGIMYIYQFHTDFNFKKVEGI